MQRSWKAGSTLLAALVVVSSAQGFRAGPPLVQPVPLRVAQAELVVVGKVVAVEDKLVKAARWPGDPGKGDFRVFNVKIEKQLLGKAELTNVKVGCLVVEMPPRKPGVPRPGVGQGAPMLEKGQEVLLFLKPHSAEPFHILQSDNDRVDKRAAAVYKRDLDAAQRAAKLFADPKAGLKAKDAADRYLTAAMLVHKYRTPTVPNAKQEEIAAEESKLIIEGLLAGNWQQAGIGQPDLMGPMQLFLQLDAQAAGWKQPQDFRQQPASMKKFLQDNVEKFRIKRFINGKI